MEENAPFPVDPAAPQLEPTPDFLDGLRISESLNRSRKNINKMAKALIKSIESGTDQQNKTAVPYFQNAMEEALEDFRQLAETAMKGRNTIVRLKGR